MLATGEFTTPLLVFFLGVLIIVSGVALGIVCLILRPLKRPVPNALAKTSGGLILVGALVMLMVLLADAWNR